MNNKDAMNRKKVWAIIKKIFPRTFVRVSEIHNGKCKADCVGTEIYEEDSIILDISIYFNLVVVRVVNPIEGDKSYGYDIKKEKIVEFNV